MSSRPFWLVLSTLAWISPPAVGDLISAEIDRSLEKCSSKLKEDATGWQKLQLVLASRDDWIEVCAEQIQSDLRAAADRDYESGNLTDQSFRRQRLEIDKYISPKKSADIEYADPSVEKFVTVDGSQKSRTSSGPAGDILLETPPGYRSISK